MISPILHHGRNIDIHSHISKHGYLKKTPLSLVERNLVYQKLQKSGDISFSPKHQCFLIIGENNA